MVARMKAEKTSVDDLLKSLEDCLINDASSKIVTKYKIFMASVLSTNHRRCWKMTEMV
jgi:hypothetical protein